MNSSRDVRFSSFESEIARIAWSIVMGSSPNFCIRLFAKYSHLQIKCRAASCTSSLQKLQKGVVVKFILFWKWLRLLWPVISLVRGSSISVPNLNKCCPCKFRSRMAETISFVFSLILLFDHLFRNFWEMYSLILCLKKEFGDGGILFSRSGLYLVFLMFASLSADSLPWWPSCPGTHSIETKWFDDVVLRVLWTWQIVLLIVWDLDSALISACESVYIMPLCSL